MYMYIIINHTHKVLSSLEQIKTMLNFKMHIRLIVVLEQEQQEKFLQQVQFKEILHQPAIYVSGQESLLILLQLDCTSTWSKRLYLSPFVSSVLWALKGWNPNLKPARQLLPQMVLHFPVGLILLSPSTRTLQTFRPLLNPYPRHVQQLNMRNRH